METVHLMGTERVESAARTMSFAADEMKQAVINLDAALERNARFMDDWLLRFQAAMAVPHIVYEPAAPTDVQESVPEKTLESTEQFRRRIKTPSVDFPCVICGAVMAPGPGGCGKTDCCHDDIPF